MAIKKKIPINELPVNLKRGRGRPRKIPIQPVVEIIPFIPEPVKEPVVIKRGPGRPRKVLTVPIIEQVVVAPPIIPEPVIVKRGRGRPRKTPIPVKVEVKEIIPEVPVVVKRGRGRPKKNTTTTKQLSLPSQSKVPDIFSVKEIPVKEVVEKKPVKKVEQLSPIIVKKLCSFLEVGKTCPQNYKVVGTKKVKPETTPISVIKKVLFCPDCDTVCFEGEDGVACRCDIDGEIVFYDDRNDYPEAWIEVDIKVYEV